MTHGISTASYLIFAIVISISDIRNRLILNRHLLLFLFLSLLLNAADLNRNDFYKFIGISIMCLSLHSIFRGRIGAGDLKLFWVLGLWSSTFIEWLQFLAMSWLLGGLFSLGYMSVFFLLGQRKFSIPFAPFIFLGFMASI